MRPEGRAAAPELRQRPTAAQVSPPAQQRVATDSRTSRLRRRIQAAAGQPCGPDAGRGSDRPATAHAEAGPPQHGPPKSTIVDMSQELLDTCVLAEDPRQALADAPPARVAHPPAPTNRPWPPRPQKVLRLQLPHWETAPQGNKPWICVTSVAFGAPAHATTAPHSRLPRTRERLLRSQPSKEDGYLGMPRVSNPVLPHSPLTLGLRAQRRPLRPPPPPLMWMRPRARPPS